MTHSGGKPHAVGDRGQRYEISVFDETKKERIVLGWCESEERAKDMGAIAVLRPSWKDYEVRDRYHDMHPEFDVCVKCGSTRIEIEDGKKPLVCAGGPNTPQEMINMVELKRAGVDVDGVEEL